MVMVLSGDYQALAETPAQRDMLQGSSLNKVEEVAGVAPLGVELAPGSIVATFSFAQTTNVTGVAAAIERVLRETARETVFAVDAVDTRGRTVALAVVSVRSQAGGGTPLAKAATAGPPKTPPASSTTAAHHTGTTGGGVVAAVIVAVLLCAGLVVCCWHANQPPTAAAGTSTPHINVRAGQPAPAPENVDATDALEYDDAFAWQTDHATVVDDHDWAWAPHPAPPTCQSAWP